MGLIDFPSPVSWFESVKDENQKRDLINATMSALYSAQISFFWRSGSSKWAQFIGEGKALQDAATAMYLSLQALQKNKFLTLCVPLDMLLPDNISRFETVEKTK